MALETLVFWVGNTNPSITDTITIGGTAVDLTGSTVKFRMRLVGSDALKVDAAATVTDAAAGDVQYDWQTADVDTAGTYLVWWVVQDGSNTQDVNETVVVFREHAPAEQPSYVELEVFKKALTLQGQSFTDVESLEALLAASRGIEAATGRRFWKDADNTTTRVYTPHSFWRLEIDDCCDVQAVAVDRNGDGTFEEAWTLGTQYVLWPPNAAADFRPFEAVKVREVNGYRFAWLPCVDQAVQVTGQFGWTAVPEDIKTATRILASMLLKRVREAPFGVVFSQGLDSSAAMRIAKTDPQVAPILARYSREQFFL